MFIKVCYLLWFTSQNINTNFNILLKVLFFKTICLSSEMLLQFENLFKNLKQVQWPMSVTCGITVTWVTEKLHRHLTLSF